MAGKRAHSTSDRTGLAAAQRPATAGQPPAESGKLTPADDAWWTEEHGISVEVRDARPYHRYEGKDEELVRRTFADCAENQIAWAINKTEKNAPGWIAEANPYPGLGLPPIPPQLRPDHPKEEWKVDYHPFEAEDEPLYPEEHPDPKKRGLPLPVPEWGWPSPLQMRYHILSEKSEHGKVALAKAAELGFDNPERVRALLNEREHREALLEVLRAANNEKPHMRKKSGKYLLTTGPRDDPPWVRWRLG